MFAHATRRSLRDGARFAGLCAVVLAAASCYKPNITDSGFICAAAGKACPDGYKCGSDNRCSLMPMTTPPPPPPTDSGMDTKIMTDASDGGGGEPMCPAPVALCAGGPAGNDVCSPSCQNGCECGRCNVVDGKAACVAAGTVTLGDVCDPNADNCAAGLVCLLEMCGNGLARCYRHCTTNAECGGNACTIMIDDDKGNHTTYLTCDVPARACDPVAGTGCPDPALNCYLTGANGTLCDCPNNPAMQGTNNAPCTFYNDCAEGFVCISGVDGQTSPHCHFVCNVATPSCPATTHCVASSAGSKFGYCGS